MSSGSGNTTVPSGREDLSSSSSTPRLFPALYIAQSYPQPDRIGECCPIDPYASAPYIFGRENDLSPDRAHFSQIKPGQTIDGGPLTGMNLSQDQLRVTAEDHALRIENSGGTPLSCNLTDVPKGTVFMARPGDVLHLHHNCVLVVGLAPLSLPESPYSLMPVQPFGEPDLEGITGESWRIWELRERIFYAAHARRHVFILGPTGTGKELVARAIHRRSHRHRSPFIVANGAAFGSELTAYVLFGNCKDAPNVGSFDSPGFFGQAGVGVFFLDEIGEMAPRLQAALLRALEGGYNRIGESFERRTECLVICATNRGITGVKDDVLMRLGVNVDTPSLAERREDLALIVRALLLKRARADKDFAKTYLRRDSRGWEHVPVHSSLIIGLLRSPLPGNVRELDNILTESIIASKGDLPLRWPGRLRMPEPEPFVVPTKPPPPTIDEILAGLGGERPAPSRARVLEALDMHDWNIGRTAKYLDVSVDQLYRLRIKYGLLDRDNPQLQN